MTTESKTAIEITDSRGRAFSNFFAAKSPDKGPGWFVFGRNPLYAGALIKLVARPDVKARRMRNYNILVRPGWATKRAAQAIADGLNAA